MDASSRISGFLLFATYASAAVLQVGPGQQYATPCAAIAAATPGDTIQVDAAGKYAGDVCGWNTNGLTIIGVNGRPRIEAAGRSFDGKAIWVIAGDNTTVENMELFGAAVPSHNGASIRQEGANLTLRKCYIHGNEVGILTGDNPASHILIENSEFAENGYTNGFSHNIYISRVARFTLRFSYSHDAISGHLVKSRARTNFILYNRLSGESGTSSIELDLPNGGPSYVIGNIIHQGHFTENSVIVAYGEEGAMNPDSSLYFVNNTVVNDRWAGVFIRVGTDAGPALVQNNIFTGRGLLIDQPGARLSHNLAASAVFVNAADYDYHLEPRSPARNFGVSAGTVNGYSLTPVYQYVHPTCFETRKTTGAAIDVGAFEFGGGGGPDPSCSQPASLSHFSLAPSSVSGGENSKGILRLSTPAPRGGVMLALSSSDATVASVPASIMIPQGNTSTQFSIATMNVPASTSVTISAGDKGWKKSVELEVIPATPALSSLSVSPGSVVGGRTITGMVRLVNPSSANETTITLMSVPPDIAVVPSIITVPAGSSRATFPIRIANVRVTTHVTVAAIYGGVTKTVHVTVTSPDH
jgi:hypothetical protein